MYNLYIYIIYIYIYIYEMNILYIHIHILYIASFGGCVHIAPSRDSSR